jgi:rfaE bifunctional protein nucleotidyltransferase chain/domain
MAQQIAATLTTDAELQEWLQSAPRPLVFTNGCFDILHRGHVRYLQQAACLGESLLIALNSDASVKRQGKGVDRPLNCLQDRMAVIAALGCVDAVCCFDADTPLGLIISCRPDVLVKGGDWPVESIVGCKEVQSHGGICQSITFEFERSTTALLNKIRTNKI